jgi:hypothetical protein
MRNPNGLLLSLALNAALVLGLGWVWRPHTVPAPTAGVAPAAPFVTVSAGAQPPAPTQGVADPGLAPLATEAVDWSRFSTGDWRRYRDELVACGCPRPTVRHILVPLVNRHFTQRQHALAAEISAHFWEVFCPPARQWKEELEKHFEAAEAEREAALAQLFPGHWSESAAPPASRPDVRVSFLPPTLADQVLAAERNRDELIQEARTTQPQPQLQEELSQQARAGFEAELARLLTPEELTEWRARNSNRADWAKSLDGVELSPTELAEIARLKDTDRDHGYPAATSAEEKETGIKALLGPERFAEFERAQDDTYQQLRNLSRRTGLGESELNALWQAQKDMQTQAEQSARNPSLSRAERTAELAALRVRHEAAVQETLAPLPGAFEAWQRQQAGWLKQAFDLPESSPFADWLKEP